MRPHRHFSSLLSFCMGLLSGTCGELVAKEVNSLGALRLLVSIALCVDVLVSCSFSSEPCPDSLSLSLEPLKPRLYLTFYRE